jgi:predicted nuclease of predicted toxin-antitoxin system
MKLLFDQNISYRILKKLSKTFSGSSHVRLEGLTNYSDLEIWEYAKVNRFIIVSYDSDFYDISLLKGNPPKILWILTGNLRTKELAYLLNNHVKDLIEFNDNEESGCLGISS